MTGRPDAPIPTTAGRPRRRVRPGDLAALTAYALLAWWLLSRLIADPAGRYLSQGVQDQQAFEWYFGATAHALATGSSPLFSTLQNFPAGVNMLANATAMGLSIPLAPLTLVAGPQVTFLAIEWLGFAATATGWYAVFVRRLGAHRLAAFVGGLFVGFSPAMVSHGNGHPNFLAQFLVPVIIDHLLDLQRPRDRAGTVRAGFGLGLLVTWQLWMGEEVLLLASVGIAIAALVALAHRRLAWRAMLPGLLIGVLTTIVLFAGPLWWQFWGPQSYASMWQPVANNDLAALWGRATRTVGADPWASAALSMNRTEENAFFGIPLWPLLLVLAVVHWRRPVVRAASAVVVLACWLSLGTQVVLHGQPTPIPPLWPTVAHLPLLDSLLPTRFTLVAVPAMATLLVVGVDSAIRRVTAGGSARHTDSLVPTWGPLVAVGVATLVALAPMAPTRLWSDPRPAVPSFFTAGLWRDHVGDGSVLALPPPDIVDLRAADWQAAAHWEFPLVEGYFLGPSGDAARTGTRGAVRRPFSQWLAEIDRDGTARVTTSVQRAQFLADLAAWRTDLVVLPPRDRSEVLRTSVESVLGPGTDAGGVTFWDVRVVRGG